MAKRNGGIIGPDNVPAGPLGAAKGVWRLEDAFNYQKAGLWPTVLGYQIPNSLRFNAGSSDYLSRTLSTNGNKRTFTLSCWLKRSTLSSEQRILMAFTGGGAQEWIPQISSANVIKISGDTGSGYNFDLDTVALFRDVGAWYHIVIAVDTTQATAANRIILYVNGVQQTLTGSYPSQNFDFVFLNTSGSTLLIGGRTSPSGLYLNGYLSQFYFIDGQALTPSSFGETDSTTGIWIAKAYTGTYGTNGYYLKFENSAALGTDSSGNGNTWTVNNLTSVDQTTDSPTNNFCTLNPLASGTAIGGSGGTFTEGNTIFTGGSSAWCASKGTFSVTKGKWYFEAKKLTNANGTGNGSNAVGIGYAELQNNLGNYNPQNDSNIYGNLLMLNDNGWTTNFANGTQWSPAYGVANNDIAGIALDLDSNTYTFYINGVSKNSGSLGGGYDGLGLTPCIVQYGGDTRNFYFNFGNPSYSANSYTDANGFGNFSYAVPSGYYSLCSKNLAIYG